MLFFFLCDNTTKGQAQFEDKSVKLEDSLGVHWRIGKVIHGVKICLDEPGA